MPSPFPGMDPYLEGYLWSDVHQSLAAQIKRQLVPFISPRYVARACPSISSATKCLRMKWVSSIPALFAVSKS